MAFWDQPSCEKRNTKEKRDIERALHKATDFALVRKEDEMGAAVLLVLLRVESGRRDLGTKGGALGSSFTIAFSATARSVSNPRDPSGPLAIRLALPPIFPVPGISLVRSGTDTERFRGRSIANKGIFFSTRDVPSSSILQHGVGHERP